MRTYTLRNHPQVKKNPEKVWVVKANNLDAVRKKIIANNGSTVLIYKGESTANKDYLGTVMDFGRYYVYQTWSARHRLNKDGSFGKFSSKKTAKKKTKRD